MSDMLKIAAKDTNGTAKAFLVETDGKTIVSRPWAQERNEIIANVEVRDTTRHSNIGGNVIDISQYPINSLRIRSSLDADVTIGLYNDADATSTSYLASGDAAVSLVIPANNNYVNIITPEDLPVLNYLKYLKIHYKAASVPTEGSLTIVHYGRK